MMESTKVKAINAFKKHKAKISQTDIYQWLRYAADLTDKYVGPETQLRKGWSNLLSYETSNLHQKASSLVDQCIESIEDNGVYKPSNKNFLMTLNNGELITLISTVLIASIGGSWLLGTGYNQFRVDKLNEENFRLESELKHLSAQSSLTKRQLITCRQGSKELINRPVSVTTPPVNTTGNQ